MEDQTEGIRRVLTAEINKQASVVDAAVDHDRDAFRALLEQQHGQVWSTDELCADFDVIGFAAPLVVARRRSDGQKGSLYFTHSPRFYYGWEPHTR